MSILRSENVVACSPLEDDNYPHEFVESIVVDEQQTIVDADGQVIKKLTVKKPSIRKVPSSELENKGIDFRMFSVENQLAAGVNMQPCPAFGSPTLEERSNMSDYVESVLSDSNNYVQPLNENE